MDKAEWEKEVIDVLLAGSIARMKAGKPQQLLDPPDYCVRCGGDLPTIRHKEEPTLSEVGYVCPQCMEALEGM